MHFSRNRGYQVINRPNIIALENTFEADAITKTSLGVAHKTCCTCAHAGYQIFTSSAGFEDRVPMSYFDLILFDLADLSTLVL